MKLLGLGSAKELLALAMDLPWSSAAVLCLKEMSALTVVKTGAQLKVKQLPVPAWLVVARAL